VQFVLRDQLYSALLQSFATAPKWPETADLKVSHINFFLFSFKLFAYYFTTGRPGVTGDVLEFARGRQVALPRFGLSGGQVPRL
jgi:hypothetical protein